jgi:hypothetical protein
MYKVIFHVENQELLNDLKQMQQLNENMYLENKNYLNSITQCMNIHWFTRIKCIKYCKPIYSLISSIGTSINAIQIN